MKEEYNYLENLPSIMKKLQKGITITVEVEGKVNVMCISWGSIGIKWNDFIFTTYVRTNRHTHEMLLKADSFTVNIPIDKISADILKVTGTMSGSNTDKVSMLGLNLEDTNKIKSKGYKEMPITLECEIKYAQSPNSETLDKEYIDRFYPQDVSSEHHGANQDFHTCFYGKIVDSYIIK